MSDEHYPKISTSDLIGLLKDSEKLAFSYEENEMATFVKSGTSPIAKRITNIRTDIKEVPFNFAISVAQQFNCMDELLDWYKVNKNWIDGAYSVN